MYVSAEVLTIVISAAGLAVTILGAFFASFAWMIRRMDGVKNETTEVKIAVARFEGPRPRLALPH